MNYLVNAGFLVLGALLTIITQFYIDRRKRTLRTKDLARTLHAELADLVARCCFDSEAPWSQCWGPSTPVEKFNVIRLRKFAPHKPVIFSAVVGELAILGGDAPLLLIQFQNSLNALRREIENIAEGSTEGSIPQGAIKLVGFRMRQTLEPGINALKALAASVPDANQIEAFAIRSYDVNRTNAPPEGTLRDRINRLLATPG